MALKWKPIIINIFDYICNRNGLLTIKTHHNCHHHQQYRYQPPNERSTSSKISVFSPQHLFKYPRQQRRNNITENWIVNDYCLASSCVFVRFALVFGLAWLGGGCVFWFPFSIFLMSKIKQRQTAVVASIDWFYSLHNETVYDFDAFFFLGFFALSFSE